MDLKFSAKEDAFREEVKGFLKEKLTKRLSDKVKAGQRLTKEDYEEWHAVLNERGWLAPSWPEEYGGTSWSPIDKHIVEEEFALAGAPRTVPFGVNMLAPVLLKFGSDAQKSHYLPRILDGTDWWCQGYSEPGAGSDLASLKTKAERDGDHYIVNGQKTWTTLGQYADWI
ncbi:MAG: acyl-CoA dehydrogenase family protein, partial [Hyphomicrobiales bacterium]